VNGVLRSIMVASILAAYVLVAFLHVVSDLDPVQRRLSEYATGSYGVAMTAAFLLVGIGLSSVGVMLIRAHAVVVGIALMVAGVAIAVSGVFPTDPNADTAAEAVHSNASAFATFLVVCASVWWSFHDRRAGSSSRFLAVAGLALVIASVFLHDSSISGVSQRVLWGTLLTWAVVTAFKATPKDDVLGSGSVSSS
jgi:hypothetical protein